MKAFKLFFVLLYLISANSYGFHITEINKSKKLNCTSTKEEKIYLNKVSKISISATLIDNDELDFYKLSMEKNEDLGHEAEQVVAEKMFRPSNPIFKLFNSFKSKDEFCSYQLLLPKNVSTLKRPFSARLNQFCDNEFNSFVSLECKVTNTKDNKIEAGIYYLGAKLYSDATKWQKFKKQAEIEDGLEDDICYEGDWEEALENTDLEEGWDIVVNDVYGETRYPSLDVEISGPNGFTTGVILPSCKG